MVGQQQGVSCWIPLCSFLSGEPPAGQCGWHGSCFCSLHLACCFNFSLCL